MGPEDKNLANDQNKVGEDLIRAYAAVIVIFYSTVLRHFVQRQKSRQQSERLNGLRDRYRVNVIGDGINWSDPDRHVAAAPILRSFGQRPGVSAACPAALTNAFIAGDPARIQSVISQQFRAGVLAQNIIKVDFLMLKGYIFNNSTALDFHGVDSPAIEYMKQCIQFKNTYAQQPILKAQANATLIDYLPQAVCGVVEGYAFRSEDLFEASKHDPALQAAENAQLSRIDQEALAAGLSSRKFRLR